VTNARRLAVPAALACAAVLLPTSAAAAAEPERTGWWNRLSAQGLALPQPQTEPGDLRVQSGPEGPTAYTALLYTAAGSSTATLDLALREGSVVGTPEVAACPTLTTDWSEGENQPFDAAPEFDCAIGVSVGLVSEDGKTLSFDLDTSTQAEAGVWSLALVPQPDGSGTPFSLDLVKPGPQSFTAAPPETSAGPAPAPPPDPGTSTADNGAGSSAEAFAPSGFEAPVPAPEAVALSAPLVATGEAAPAAQPAAPAPPVAAPPVVPLVTAPAGVAEELGSGRRLLALLVLAGGSAALGYAAGQQRPGPRLLGGRARLGAPTLAGGPPDKDERPRGIGRFAKTRDAAPRRLL